MRASEASKGFTSPKIKGTFGDSPHDWITKQNVREAIERARTTKLCIACSFVNVDVCKDEKDLCENCKTIWYLKKELGL